MEPHKQKKKTWRDYAPIDMFLSAVSVLVVVQLISEVPEGFMNYPVYGDIQLVSLPTKYTSLLECDAMWFGD
jgi:hypothetical protein